MPGLVAMWKYKKNMKSRMHLFFTEIYIDTTSQLNRYDFVNKHTWAYPLGFYWTAVSGCIREQVMKMQSAHGFAQFFEGPDSPTGKSLLVSYIKYLRKYWKTKHRCEPNWQWEAALTARWVEDKQGFEEALSLQRWQGLPTVRAQVTLHFHLHLSAWSLLLMCL